MKKIIISAALLLSSTAVFADNCEKYVSEVDSMISEAKTHVTDPAEIKLIDDQISQMKTMINSLPEDQRDAICGQALEQIPMMKQMLEEGIKQMKAQG
ncbi:DUF5339 family protein [Thorsellia kenyensis]|uniref:DUF5339 family protein n=1 Tax=Thorsellia kenyensis TaxID=1549888 RepID=A0ABV6C820_9GAMM